MAADFYRSSHGNYWLVDRKTLAAARATDLKYASPQELSWIPIWSANAIHKLAKRLSLRQQVTATAVIYLRRFYLKNSYCETDIPLVAAACVYVAAKAEETALHIKVVVTEARAAFNEYGITSFPSDSTKLAETEFYLIEDLEFHLIVYHPYRSLVHLTGRDSGPIAIRETMLDMEDNQLQVAWLLLNDTYRTELCLLYPPHLIAIASIYLSASLVSRPPPGGRPGSSRPDTASTPGPETPASNPLSMAAQSRPASNAAASDGTANASSEKNAGRGKTDLVTFLASLDVSLPIVLEIVQEMISLYACWKAFDEPPNGNGAAGQTPATPATPTNAMSGLGMQNRLNGNVPIGPGDEKTIKLLARMRQAREVDLAHPANAGQP